MTAIPGMRQPKKNPRVNGGKMEEADYWPRLPWVSIIVIGFPCLGTSNALEVIGVLFNRVGSPSLFIF